ncbi:MAG: Alcohol dehydrogenase [Chloroflexi bacterium ADurb.Bin325]|nr:MAG: Alcohol dehydrogenase [Chloroflexi bacterium ADurb.Bin325]
METEAIVFTGVGEVALQTIDMPDPAPGEVQIRTRYSVISAGTEGWTCRNLFTWSPTRYPCVPGYQRVGVITKVGAGVAGWQVGDVVMATSGRWEGPVRPFWGAHLADANTVAAELYRIPAGADELDAAGAVVAQVGFNAAHRVALAPGDWVAVYGDGLIGQSAAQAARARGARVILVGHRPERLALAAQHSADIVVNGRQEPVAEAVRRHTDGQPLTAVLDTVQTEDAQREYVPLLERGRGQIVYSGYTPGTAWADMALLQQRELTTHFVSGWTRPRMEATLALMAAGKMRLRPLITHLTPHTSGPAMYRMILDKSAPFVGIAFDWR